MGEAVGEKRKFEKKPLHRSYKKVNSEKLIAYTIAERYARKLEKLRAEGHLAVTTWDSGRISVRAISWAYQHTKVGGLDADKY